MFTKLSRRAFSHTATQHLAYEVYDSPGTHKVLYIVHGLLGSARNWRSLSNGLRKALGPDTWRVVAVDLRGHGKSTPRQIGSGERHDVVNAASDVEALARSRGETIDVVVGHSLGGKIALELSRLAANAPKQIWSLDSVPGRVVGDTHGVAQVLDAVVGLPRRIPSRRKLAELLAPFKFSAQLVDWLGSNLQAVGENELEFVFDIDIAKNLYDSYRVSDSWHAIEAPVSNVFIVKAELSTRWRPECLQRLHQAPQSRVKLLELANAGHWLHADNPSGLIEMLSTHISKI